MAYRPSRRQLEYFVAVAETGHFGEAARRCHVSQPTLSVQVALMERRLGARLLDRVPGRIAPTPAGDKILRTARQVLAAFDDIVAIARADQHNLGGLIRLGVAPSFGPYFLPHLLPQLHAQFPALQLYIREDRPAAVERDVIEGALDCGLGPQPVGGQLRFRELFREKIFLGLPREHPLAARRSVSPADLEGERLLTLGRGHRLLDDVRELAAASRAEVVQDYEGTSLDAISQMVSIGMGLSLFPELYARSEFGGAQNVILLPIENWPGTRSIGYYWRNGSVREAHFEGLVEESDRALRGLLERDG